MTPPPPTSAPDPRDWAPHEPSRSEAQIDWLRGDCCAADVLDLGCGSGRIARELAEHASSWHAIDMDEAAVSACQAAAPAAVVSRADLRTPPFGEAAFDVVLLLGNTLCLLWDVDEAVDAMLQWRKLLRPGGRLILDDVPGDLWPELAEGRWCAGVDDGETQQMVWADDDAVFAVRAGSAVDCDHWTLAAGDRRMRLWSTGAIRLAARASGFAGPTRHPDAGVLVLRPTRDGRPD